MTTGYLPLVAQADRGTPTTRPGEIARVSIGSTGLRFTGWIRAKSTNTNDIVIQGVANSGVSGTIGKADPPLMLQGVDLSQIIAKSGHAGDIVQLAGVVDIV